MSTPTVPSRKSRFIPEVPELPSHTLGFVDTPAACDAMVTALQQAGISEDSVLTFEGPVGLEAYIELMKGFQWGESAEKLLKDGTDELNEGHVVVCVHVKDEEEAAIVAAVSNQYGGRKVTHFGTWVDTRLT